MKPNEPVRVYDTSGPWGDPDFDGNVEQGLPQLRDKWIRDRGDVEEIEGRKVQPIDDGYLSDKHAAIAEQKRSTSNVQHPTFNGRATESVYQLSSLNYQLRRRAARSALRLVIPSRSSGTRARASSRRRWNSSRSEKTDRAVAAVSDRRNQNNRRSQSAATRRFRP